MSPRTGPARQTALFVTCLVDQRRTREVLQRRRFPVESTAATSDLVRALTKGVRPSPSVNGGRFDETQPAPHPAGRRDCDRRQRLCEKLYAELRCSTVVTAVGGGDDLRALREATFDVCVLSLSNGFSALDEAQALRLEYPDVPIVAVDGDLRGLRSSSSCSTAECRSTVARRCIECPANQRLSSSIEWAVERNRLLRHLEQVLDESERRSSLHDALTCLPNRKLFVDRLGHLIQRCARTTRASRCSSSTSIASSAFNDTLGHEGGDQLLAEVARRLSACVRVSDTCARWGGDEVPRHPGGRADQEDATAIARKIARRLVEPTLIGGREVQISASIGISICPLDSRHGPTLIHQADLAMYRAKAAGGGPRPVLPW